MKYSKVAAAVAGSVMAVGMAAPAFADGSLTGGTFADTMSAMPTSVNGGVDQALSTQPLQRAVDETAVGGVLDKLTGTVQNVSRQTSADSLLGQTAAAAKSGALSTVAGAVPGASLLGGLPLGALGH
ncbi:hypothetical protein [Actinacidiphila sp. ITFR-21]|uniref:hypothetical protein n=1 Tax=Actinacidiphila sp. ITFR-21 TaxID=3075199 RepID=UPI002889D899|nr:hypothetical protein [Streptomyces sp. ITFR-21]WNI16481.1 hypothetical protein RLT57_13775 [Streptomyces sp. ITFR-21]